MIIQYALCAIGVALLVVMLRATNLSLRRITEMEKRIMAAFEDLTAEVEETTTGIDSAITLIKGLSQLIKDAGNDPAKLKALTDKLDAKNKELADAVVANTPQEPPTA